MLLRPVIDFASNTYHSMLSLSQIKLLDDLQKRALKIIFGTNCDYDDLLEKSGLVSLAERRQNMFTKFILKCSQNPKVKDIWFPVKTVSNYNTRTASIYEETTARTERLIHSPIFEMRKLLNNLTST